MKMRKVLSTIKETSNVDLHISNYKNEQVSQINEIWLPCSMCEERVNLCSLINHKQWHKANNELGCKPEDSPSNLHILAVQKEKMISRIESSSQCKYREHQKINQSFEILKGKLLSMAPYTSRMWMPSEANCHVYDMNGNDGLVKSIVICSDKNASWQSCMEDSFTVLNNYGHRQKSCFAGIFDGYHGNAAALAAAAEFPILLQDHISAMDPSYKLNEEERLFIGSFNTIFKDNYKETEHVFSIENKKGATERHVESIHQAYAKAFWRMDRMLKLGRKESSKSRWSGCAAVTCLIEGFAETDNQIPTDEDTKWLGMFHVANIGNIKAVLCKNGKSHCLTRDHSTANGQERKRVLKSGGSVSSNESYGLIEGFCTVTRGLGFHGDVQLKKSVIPAPHTISVPIYSRSQFLILASSGLWEVLSTSEVVAMARDLLTTFFKFPQDVNPNNMRTEEDSESDDIECGQDELGTSKQFCATHGEPDSQGNNSEKEIKTDDASKMYNTAAIFVCQQIMKAAMLAGSQQNITVCLILLPGCEKGFSPDQSSG
ncbi:protein phosphatase 2C-like domain-containing protein 1 isoform X2 [Ranitomeya variabilis]|uniref:protein phosphatase 2C-like domain-containing protein 1 isoform X2 n=2 Tax=Ranitomeya variabilis TaxID=490064 RepID=UPI004055E3C0